MTHTPTLSPSDIDQEIANHANDTAALSAILDAHDGHGPEGTYPPLHLNTAQHRRIEALQGNLRAKG